MDEAGESLWPPVAAVLAFLGINVVVRLTIPAEGVWSGDLADLPNWDAMPRRNRRKRRRAPYPIWLKYLVVTLALAVVLSLAQIALQAYRADPRDARVFAERELRLTILRPTERVAASVSVWQRPLIDYFRATRGILVVTDAPPDSTHPVGGRLIYLGLQPRDPLSPADAPPTFDEREWPIDTLVRLTPTRTFFFVAPALEIAAPREPRLVLGYPAGAARWRQAALPPMIDEEGGDRRCSPGDSLGRSMGRMRGR